MSESNVISAEDRFAWPESTENTLNELTSDVARSWLTKFLSRSALEMPEFEVGQAAATLERVMDTLIALTAFYISQQELSAAAATVRQLEAMQPVPELEAKLAAVIQEIKQPSGKRLIAIMTQSDPGSEVAA